MNNKQILYCFRKRNFILLSIGGFISIIGTLMQDTALSLYVLMITGSAIKFASVLSVAIIPDLFISPIAGILVDRLDRKKIVIIIDFFRGIFIGMYVVLFSINGSITLPQIYILVIILEMSSIFYRPAQKTMIPSIVSKENLINATSLYSSITQIGCLIAPSFGGMIYGICGLKYIFIINSISFIISGVSKMFMEIEKSISSINNLTLSLLKNDLSEGAKFLKNNNLIKVLTITMFILTIGIESCTSIGYIYIIKKNLAASDFQYGIMETFDVIGGLIGSLAIPFIRKKIKLQNIIFKSVLFSAIVYCILSLTSCNIFISLFHNNMVPYSIILIISCIISVLATLMNISVQVEFQQNVPISIMGRIFTAFDISINIATLFSQMLFGFLYDILSVPICIIISSLFLFIGLFYFKTKITCNYVYDSDTLRD